jgi:hypothetical protein
MNTYFWNALIRSLAIGNGSNGLSFHSVTCATALASPASIACMSCSRVCGTPSRNGWTCQNRSGTGTPRVESVGLNMYLNQVSASANCWFCDNVSATSSGAWKNSSQL